MMCYKDKTFCPFNDCAGFRVCKDAYSDEVKKGAMAWMGRDAPVCLYAEPPDCFVDAMEEIYDDEEDFNVSMATAPEPSGCCGNLCNGGCGVDKV